MSDETTTDKLAEIEGQADYTPPEGWRVVQAGETIAFGDRWVRLEDGQLFDARRIGETVRDGTFLRRIPQAEPQPVQVREGRWRTRGGEIRHVTPTPEARKKLFNQSRYSWYDAQHNQTWLPSGHYTLGGESQWDLLDYLGPIEAEPGQIITPDDVAAEALAGGNDWPSVQTLRQKLETTEAALLEQQQRNEQLVTHGSQQHMEIAELQAQVAFLKNRELTLGTRLEEEKTVTTKRLQQVEELRSEVSYVQGLLGDERRRFTELETLTSDLRAVNTAQEKGINAAARDKADLESRLRAVAAEFGVQLETNNRLQTQLEAVKAESAKRLETIQELRSEVSQVHRLWGESRWRVEELEQKLAEARPQPVHQQAIIDAQAETIARLHSEVHGLNMEIAEQQKAVNGTGAVNDVLRQQLEAILADWELQAKTISGLQTQLEAVKAELVQERLERNQWQNHAQRTETQLVEKVSECRNLRIELDALQQAPEAEAVAAVATSTDDRFEEGLYHGTARAVETIAEWLEPLRKGNTTLRAAVLFHLPTIMRSLTGLTDED